MRSSKITESISFRPLLRAWHLVLVAAALLSSACGGSKDDAASLQGTFRSERASPITLNQVNTHYTFARDGTVVVSSVDASGKTVGTPIKQGFTLIGRKITLRPLAPVDPSVLYLPMSFTYVSRDKLTLEGSDTVLRRVKG